MWKSSAWARSTLAGLHNPQGRVIALLAVARTSADEFFAVLPRELAPGVAQRLRKFVLRSKVRHRRRSRSTYACSAARRRGAATRHRQLAWGTRRLLLAPRDRLGEFDVADAAALARWQMRRHC